MSTFRYVGPQFNADGAGIDLNARQNVYGGAVNSDTCGTRFEDTLNGETQIFTTTTAAALLLSATTGNCPTIWNPSTSNKIFIPTKVVLGFLSGTTTIGSVLWATTVTQGGTAVIATTGPVITFTNAAAVNGGIGGPSPKPSGMLWAPAVCTFVAAPVVLAPTGINLGAAAPTNGGNSFIAEQNGDIILWPGNALSLVYSVTTSTALYFATIYGVTKSLPSMR